VIDRDVPLSLPPEPFAVFPTPREYAYMIEAVR
jgi:hypothetical protein